jgi:hypothetical protein
MDQKKCTITLCLKREGEDGRVDANMSDTLKMIIRINRHVQVDEPTSIKGTHHINVKLCHKVHFPFIPLFTYYHHLILRQFLQHKKPKQDFSACYTREATWASFLIKKPLNKKLMSKVKNKSVPHSCSQNVTCLIVCPYPILFNGKIYNTNSPPGLKRKDNWLHRQHVFHNRLVELPH